MRDRAQRECVLRAVAALSALAFVWIEFLRLNDLEASPALAREPRRELAVGHGGGQVTGGLTVICCAACGAPFTES